MAVLGCGKWKNNFNEALTPLEAVFRRFENLLSS